MATPSILAGSQPAPPKLASVRYTQLPPRGCERAELELPIPPFAKRQSAGICDPDPPYFDRASARSQVLSLHRRLPGVDEVSNKLSRNPMRPQKPFLTSIRTSSEGPKGAAAVVSGDCHPSNALWNTFAR
jgi:hypothetical protein